MDIAIQMDNPTRTRFLLTRFPDLLHHTQRSVHERTTWLHLAAMHDSVNVARVLIAAGISADCLNNNAQTPLCIAASMRHPNRTTDIIDLLLSSGANPNGSKNQSDSPLHCAVVGDSNERMIAALIDGGANIEIRNQFNQTPLMYAARRGYIRSVKQLIDAGADVFAVGRDADRGVDDLTAVELARRGGQDEMVDFLESYVQVMKAKQTIDNAEKIAVNIGINQLS